MDERVCTIDEIVLPPPPPPPAKSPPNEKNGDKVICVPPPASFSNNHQPAVTYCSIQQPQQQPSSMHSLQFQKSCNVKPVSVNNPNEVRN